MQAFLKRIQSPVSAPIAVQPETVPPIPDLWRAVLILLLSAWVFGASADALDGVLEVRSAYVNIDNGVFLLHARVEYP